MDQLLKVTRFTLPPSPNWQQSNVLACNDNGLLAYGSKADITLLDITTSEKQMNVNFISMAHKEKINAVVFSPSFGSFKNCLASCGEDGVVRVWNFVEHRLLYSHNGHKDGVKVVGLDWSRADPNRIVSVNDLGTIIIWDLASNTIRCLLCGVKVLPLSLACCPHDKDIIAVGCKGGITFVIDVKGSGKIIHRLRGHDQGVISVSWCPVPYNVVKYQRNTGKPEESEEREKEMLLATGGLERTIFIWRTATDGRYELAINLPNQSFTTNQRRKGPMQNAGHIMLWTVVHWVDAYMLLSSSQFGEVYAWDFNGLKANNKKPQPRTLHSKHPKGVFSIACPVDYDLEPDWRNEKRVVWTTAMDKHLVACTLVSGLVKVNITTLGGVVFTMDISPLDPNMLAIGTGDGKIFIWNMGDIRALNIASYWRKIIGKVMTVVWHPTEENILAFGTGDGHVGVLNVSNHMNVPTLLRLHHCKPVYRLRWAPPLIKSDDETKVPKLVLFSQGGDGDLVQYTADLSKPDEVPKSLNLAVLNSIDHSQELSKPLSRTDMVFNKSRFAVACDNGSVYIVSCETLKLLNVFYPHKKVINNLEWHPETVASDSGISPYCDYLAISCDNIKVYNIPMDGQADLVATLSGHSAKIVGLAWSPYYNGRLISSSYDTTVQVWDVPSQSCLGVYTGHTTTAMCAVFSPLDPDAAISGSGDSTVHVWTTAELEPPAPKIDTKKMRLESVQKDRDSAQEATELTVDSENPSKLEKQKQNTSLSSSDHISITSTNSEKVTVSENGKKRQQNNQGTVFLTTRAPLVHARHFDLLAQRLKGTTIVPDSDIEPPSLKDIGYLDFFGDEKAMRRLLMVEESNLIEHRNYSLAQQSALWRGDVSQMIEEAITKKNMSDWLISMAPIAGFDVWERACAAYADQLSERGEAVRAATYLLAVNRTHDAVRLLASHEQYREAVAVARCRLPPDDPAAADVYNGWGHHTVKKGQMALAAHCFLAAGNMQACIETLGRHKELRSLKMAAILALEAGKSELAASMAVECLSLAVATSNFPVGHQLIARMPQYKAWSVWLHTGEQLGRVRNRGGKEVFAWLEGIRPGPFALWEELEKKTSVDTMVPETLYIQLRPYLPTNKTPEFERDMWYYVSAQLAAAYAAKIESKPELFLRHVVSALSAAFHFQTCHPQTLAVLLVAFILTPNGLLAKDSILLQKYESPGENKLMKSLRAFVFASIIHWMNNNWNKVTRMNALSSETPVESEVCQQNGSGDSSQPATVSPAKITWLTDLFTGFSCDVLDAENLSFFLKKAQKQALVDAVAKQNIQIHSAVTKTGGKKNKSKSKSNDDKGSVKPDKNNSSEKDSAVNSGGQVEKVKKLDENLNLKVTESQPNTPSSAQPTNESNEKTSDYVEKKSDVLVNNSEISASSKEALKSSTDLEDKSSNETSSESAVKKPLEPIQESAVDENKQVDEPVKSVEVDTKLKELKELEQILSKFESERVSVPSPFTAYMNIKYLVDNLISKQDSKIAQEIQENCDKLWKKSQS